MNSRALALAAILVALCAMPAVAQRDFNGAYPFIDVSSGGRIEGVIAAVDADRFVGLVFDSLK